MFIIRIKSVEFTFYDDGTVGIDVDYNTNEDNILDLIDLEQAVAIAKNRVVILRGANQTR